MRKIVDEKIRETETWKSLCVLVISTLQHLQNLIHVESGQKQIKFVGKPNLSPHSRDLVWRHQPYV